MYTRRPHRVSYTSEVLTLPDPSERYAFDKACTWTSALLSNHGDPDSSLLKGLNLIVEFGRLDVLRFHAFPDTTRRISICGDMHYRTSCPA